VIQHTNGIKLQVDVVGLDITALIDWWQIVDERCTGTSGEDQRAILVDEMSQAWNRIS